MPLKELGQQIREMRESKGLTIQEFSNKLKISPTILNSIEDGDISEMPEAVYARSFIKSYAQHVGLDMAEVLVVLDSCFSFEDAKEYTETVLTMPKKYRAPHIKIAAVLLLVLVLAGVAWFFLSDRGKQTSSRIWSSNQSTPAVTSQNTANTFTAAQGATASTPSTTTGIGTGTEVSSANQEGSTSLSSVDDNAPMSNDENQEGAEQSTQTEVTTSKLSDWGTKHTVRLVANADCWIKTQTRPNKMFTDTIKAGEVYEARYDNVLQITVGAPANVDIYFNGQKFTMTGFLTGARTFSFPGAMPAN